MKKSNNKNSILTFSMSCMRGWLCDAVGMASSRAMIAMWRIGCRILNIFMVQK